MIIYICRSAKHRQYMAAVRALKTGEWRTFEETEPLVQAPASRFSSCPKHAGHPRKHCTANAGNVAAGF